VGVFQDVTVWHGCMACCLIADCQLVSDKGRRQLHSDTSRTCFVRWTYSNYAGTAVFQLQVRNCGTAFQLNCDKLTLAFNDLSGY